MTGGPPPRSPRPTVGPWRSPPGTGSGRRSCGAAVRLCRLPDGSTPAGARAALRRLYDQFDEGFGTPDLLAAQALLDR